MIPLRLIGKENDIESGLGDFGVRKYDDAAGRFLSIDPLWEKYLAWSQYHYCGNNPVNAVDREGTKVKAVTQIAQDAIINSVEKDLRKYVEFDDNGFAKITMDIEPLSTITNTNGDINVPSNLEALQTLVSSSEVFHVKECKVGDKIPIKSTDGTKKNANIIPEISGISFFKTNKNGELRTTDGTNTIYLNTESSKPINKVAAHELYGHALFWLFNISNSHSGPNKEVIQQRVNEAEGNAE